MPKHLQFTKGWPHCVPTADESEKLAEMRRSVCALYEWESPYLDADVIRDRYDELMKSKKIA